MDDEVGREEFEMQEVVFLINSDNRLLGWSVEPWEDVNWGYSNEVGVWQFKGYLHTLDDFITWCETECGIDAVWLQDILWDEERQCWVYSKHEDPEPMPEEDTLDSRLNDIEFALCELYEMME